MNNNLNKARKEKNDEFYTQYKDIEKECQHYVEHLKDQWIYLPCDDEDSNFWKYFIDHFNEYGLKRLTATHINLDGTPSYRLDYDGLEVSKTSLNGNGDFRSEECTKIKNECDMVITNPPFSLFREFIKWLQDNTLQIKKFLIIGSSNAIRYKDIFPFLKNREVFVHSANDTISFTMFFITDSGEIKSTSSIWFTNLNRDYVYRDLKLDKKYDADKYNHLLNYDCINVDKVKDIPYDYEGVMSVPITVMFYNPQQFDIIGCTPHNVPNGFKGMSKEFIDLYKSQGGTGQYSVGNNTPHYITNDGKARTVYNRILIKLKKNE